jgi:NAD+ synthetase
MYYQIVTNNIRNELKTYIQKNNLKSLVLGISGGIDSTLVAVLVSKVCKELNIPLIGRSISIETNKEDEIKRSIMVGEIFCDKFKTVDLTSEYLNLTYEIDDREGYFEDQFKNNIRTGNIKARLRMIYLYNLAGIYNGMVLSTDNLTEYNLGFWTICGDVGDYEPIISLWKTEVYQLSKYLAEQGTSEEYNAIMECVNATPTDGLGITNSDLDQLGVSSYELVDEKLKNFIYNGIYDKNCPVIKRHLNSNFKRQIPIGLDRKLIFRGVK